MELRNILSFVAVCDTGSVSLAARRVHLAASSVSAHIAQLEVELNTSLFNRSGKEMILTEAGSAFLLRARNIINEAQKAREELAAMHGHLCGELRIGVGSFIEPYIRESAILFMQRYPDVVVRPTFTDAETLNEKLRAKSLDLAFTMNTAYANEGIDSQPCIPFHLSAIMPSDHPLAAQRFITYDDMLSYRILLPDVGDRVFATFQSFAPFDISQLRPQCTVPVPDIALKVLRPMQLITFLPSLYADEHPGLVARPIKGLEKTLMSNAHWLRSAPLKASAKAFLEIVHDVVSSHSEKNQ